jgi:hypothetical protein
VDHTTFAVTCELSADTRAGAVERANDRLRRALVAVADHVVRGERCTPTDDGHEVTLLVELTRLPPRLRTNLAFHALVPDATVRAV